VPPGAKRTERIKMLEIKETYINKGEDTIFGESPWMDAYSATWEQAYRSARSEFGRCTGKIYRDVRVQGDYPPPFPARPAQRRETREVRHVGWVFQGRDKYGDTGETYLREVWVEVREKPDTTDD
jgi:hypothetical protein